MKILAFAGALRRGSLNKKFVQEALRVVASNGVDGEYVDLLDYPMPVYDGDLESASGIPLSVSSLGNKIRASDALIVSAPEYNGSIAAPLKNTIDWLSREKPHSLLDKPLLLLAASPGALGGVRGLWHTRVPFEVLGVQVFASMMGLPSASKAFDEAGRLIEDKSRNQLKELVEKFIEHNRV